MLRVATDRGRRTTPLTPLPWRQRFHAGRPQAGGGLDAGGIGKAGLGDAGAEAGVVAVSCVGQYDPGGEGGANLVERNPRLGLKDDIVGDTRLRPAVKVVNPLMRQIQAIGRLA